jgi:hypothetical protein
MGLSKFGQHDPTLSALRKICGRKRFALSVVVVMASFVAQSASTDKNSFFPVVQEAIRYFEASRFFLYRNACG